LDYPAALIIIIAITVIEYSADFLYKYVLESEQKLRYWLD